MQNPLHDGPGVEPLVVQLPGGKASYQRDTANLAHLEIEYRIPLQRAVLANRSLEEGIEAIRDAEISRMRHILQELGHRLASQLKQEGVDPDVRRDWRNKEDRIWMDHGDAVLVRPTVYRLRENLRGYGDASDAKLVRETVRQLIKQREENIRDIYQKVLTEALPQR